MTIITKRKYNKYGLSNHSLYQVWNDIIKRTNNIKCKAYKHYGERGITVCDRWLNISNFIDDMYPSYQEGLSIDRINNDGNYEPSNCRWVTNVVQHRNTRLIRINNKSGYRGVSCHKGSGKWQATIGINGKLKHLGYFDTAIDAARAYDKYVIDNNLEHTKNFKKDEK